MAMDAALKRFGQSSLRPQQKPIIEATLEGSDILAVLPTGSGKSLCYQLPALLEDGLSIVISPLLALMRDQIRTLHKLGVPCFHISSAQSDTQNHENLSELRLASQGLLYLSPEQLSKSSIQQFLTPLPLSRLIIDEAHCFSEWGHDFRPDYQRLPEFANRHNLPVSAFTATASLAVIHDLHTRLFNGREPTDFIHSPRRENIEISFMKKNKPRAQLLSALRDEPSIIYAATRNKTQVLAQALCEQGFNAQHYHAGLESEHRREIEAAFIAGKMPIIVATNAFGMGVDHPSIRTVIHADMPSSLEAYVQEIGRAGRDGLPARAICLFGEEDYETRLGQIETTTQSTQRRNVQTAQLDQIYKLAQNNEGWEEIEAYFVSDFLSNHQIEPKAKLNEESLIALKRWRYQTAQAKKTVPYMILPDALLENIAKAHPQNIDALAAIKGMGARRIEKYGASILQALEGDLHDLSKPRQALALEGNGALYDALFNTMRELRFGKLGNEKPLECPPNLLRRIIKARPKSLAQFSQISGMNFARTERFGEAFLLVLERHSR